MTTRELADHLARVVLTTIDQDETADLAGALLLALKDQGCWFCRMSQTPAGVTVTEQMELFEPVTGPCEGR